MHGSLRHTRRKQPAKRPDLILTGSRPGGADTFVDYTTRWPSHQRLVTRAATIPGFAADDGVTEKLKTWEPHVRAQGDIIHPYAWTRDGGSNWKAGKHLEEELLRLHVHVGRIADRGHPMRKRLALTR